MGFTDDTLAELPENIQNQLCNFTASFALTDLGGGIHEKERLQIPKIKEAGIKNKSCIFENGRTILHTIFPERKV